jgi:hypothetical protein
VRSSKIERAHRQTRVRLHSRPSATVKRGDAHGWAQPVSHEKLNSHVCAVAKSSAHTGKIACSCTAASATVKRGDAHDWAQLVSHEELNSHVCAVAKSSAHT